MEAIFALSTTGFIEKYGAYAGLAAIPGLAVLSLLYFAQAREVRRLREWAGRAPERDVDRSTSGVHVAPTGARDPVSVVRRSPPPGSTRRPGTSAVGPGGQVAPDSGPGPSVPAATAAAAGGAAAGAAAGATAAKAADRPGAPSAAPDGEKEPGPADAPSPSPAAAPSNNGPADPSVVERPAPADPAPRSGAPAARPGAPAAATAAGAAGVRAAAPVAPTRAPARERDEAAAPAAAAVRPATPGAAPRSAPLRADRPRASAGGRAGGRDPVPPRRDGAGGRPRRAAYIAVAAVLLIVLVVVIVAATSGGGSSSKSTNTIAPNQQASGGAAKHHQATPPVQRGSVKVAVLNGTTQAGLAAQLGDQITAGGFAKGQVTNAADQQAPKTVVYYASGQKRAAQEVASIVKAGAVQPLDANTHAIAGNDAKVVVLVGADKT